MIIFWVFVRLFFIVVFSAISVRTFILILSRDNTLISFLIGCALCSMSLMGVLYVFIGGEK